LTFRPLEDVSPVAGAFCPLESKEQRQQEIWANVHETRESL